MLAMNIIIEVKAAMSRRKSVMRLTPVLLCFHFVHFLFHCQQENPSCLLRNHPGYALDLFFIRS